jgi:hypothetical protein
MQWFSIILISEENFFCARMLLPSIRATFQQIKDETVNLFIDEHVCRDIVRDSESTATESWTRIYAPQNKKNFGPVDFHMKQE